MNIEELKQERYRLQAQGNILEEVKVLQRIADESKNILEQIVMTTFKP